MKLSEATDNAERMLCVDFDIRHDLRQAELCFQVAKLPKTTYDPQCLGVEKVNIEVFSVEVSN